MKLFNIVILLLLILFLPVKANAYTFPVFPTFPPCFPFCSITPVPTTVPTNTPTATPTLPVNPTPTAGQSGKILFGAYVGDQQYTMTPVTQFENLVGKKISLLSWYQAWANTDGTQYFQTNWMNQVVAHGSIPMITFEPWNYTAGVNQPNYKLANIYNGQYDTFLKKWASDSKNFGGTYYLRFGHEMNGNWYPWAEQVNGNKAGDYVKAYKHVHDIFMQAGATNVKWVWCPNVVYQGSTSLTELYPGDNYVDYLCMDGYNWGYQNGGWLTFTQVFNATYLQLTQLSSKPILIGETASSEINGSKAQWITNAYGFEIDQMSNVFGIVWFNINKEEDWRVNSSQSSLNAFKAAIQNAKYK